MKKYLSIFLISFRQDFAYKLSFVMWRFRNVMQILVFFFLWSSVFTTKNTVFFGYTKEKIIAYAFLLIFIKAVVLSSKSIEVSSQISNGVISNFLTKPINFFKYWLVRDVSSKILNICFSVVEISVLFLILKPIIFVQTNFLYILLFIFSLCVASLIFFCLSMLTNFVSFWIPEIGWGAQFLVVIIFVEFLSGAFFPLDVFPKTIYNILQFTPFPYLIFVPIKTYLGIESIGSLLRLNLAGLVWVVVLMIIMKKVWNKGLKAYEAVGR